MRRFCLLLTVLLCGCAARLAPTRDGQWSGVGVPPRDPPEFSLYAVAGEYDTHTPVFSWTALQIETDGRWTYYREGFTGRTAFSSGSARVSGDSIVLEKKDAIGFPTGDFVVLTLVRWGDRRYLFGPGDFVRFCNALNWGYEPDRSMHGEFLLRDEGAEAANIIIPVAGPPELPQRWLDAILRKPIDGVIREILPDGRFRVDVGGADGVFQGMELRTEDAQGRYFLVLRVVSFTEHECVLEPAWAPEWKQPEVGWKVRCDARGAEFAPR